MTSELCRVTVHGPDGRADLAVPVSVPVATLLPVLLSRTGPTERQPDDSWVLQRLTGPPLEPGGTPESLDWRDGEELYLRPAADPLPELDFDDVADGMATVVRRRPGRWRPEYHRRLFLASGVATLLVLAVSLLAFPPDGSAATVAAEVVAAAMLGAAMVAGRREQDAALILLLGLAGCGFAGIAAAFAAAGPLSAVDLQGRPVLAGGLAVTAAAGLLLGTRTRPAVPFGVLGLTGLLTAAAQWLHLAAGTTPPQVAGLLCTMLLATMVFAPRLAIRFARIRGPQLPRTAEELQRDVEPAPATDLAERTVSADGFITVVAVGSAVLFAGSFPFLVRESVFGLLLAVLTAVAALLRARMFLGVWQRGSLATAGAFGLALATLVLANASLAGALGLLALAFGVSLVAILRPPGRRLLPVWGHLANGLETVSALAVVPVLLQVAGVYARVRGLVG